MDPYTLGRSWKGIATCQLGYNDSTKYISLQTKTHPVIAAYPAAVTGCAWAWTCANPAALRARAAENAAVVYACCCCWANGVFNRAGVAAALAACEYSVWRH